jgi:AraC-like DNA-binding protein
MKRETKSEPADLRVHAFRPPKAPDLGAVLGVDITSSREGGVGRLCPGHYGLMFLVQGAGDYDDDINGKRRLAAGDVLVLFHGLWQRYFPDPDLASIRYHLMFSGNLFIQLEADGLLDRHRPVRSPGLSPALVSSFSRIINDYAMNPEANAQMLAAKVHMLLLEIEEAERSAEARAKNGNFVHRACGLLEQGLEKKLSPASVAGAFDLSYERFRKRFVAEAGVSPAHYRLIRRIDLAKELLREGRLPIKAIAMRLGYSRINFFRRQFKQMTGMKASEYVRKQKG